MLRVAMLSGWHVHARGYANQLKNMPDVEITAVWDEDSQRGKSWADELGADFEPELDALLQRDDVDGVVVTAPTNMHRDIMVAAAGAGKHIFTEKVMALTVQECNDIAEAVKKADVKFCICFPHRIEPANLFAKTAIDNGLLGDVTLVRVRNAHDGTSANWLPEYFYDPIQCGGGAMMDLGAHPMYLCRWLLGEPKCISAMFNSFTAKPVEDNAVAVIEFKNKALAIAETGFVSSHSPFSLEVYGTAGSLLIGGVDGKVHLHSDIASTDMKGWLVPDSLPERLPHPIEQWVNGILHDTPISFGIDEGIQLTELMQAAYISHKEGRKVEFPII